MNAKEHIKSNKYVDVEKLKLISNQENYLAAFLIHYYNMPNYIGEIKPVQSLFVAHEKSEGLLLYYYSILLGSLVHFKGLEGENYDICNNPAFSPEIYFLVFDYLWKGEDRCNNKKNTDEIKSSTLSFMDVDYLLTLSNQRVEKVSLFWIKKSNNSNYSYLKSYFDICSSEKFSKDYEEDFCYMLAVISKEKCSLLYWKGLDKWSQSSGEEICRVKYIKKFINTSSN